MTIFKKLTVISLLSAILLSLIFIASARAVSSNVTDQQIQRIRENCLSAKATLKQLHASDALLRVNRGQIYESISIKLMSKFNGRVANNGLDNSTFVSVTNRYNLALDDFRSHYIKYEEHLSAAIAVDCLKQPVSFYDAVSVANSDRIKVHSDITKLNQAIDQYRSSLTQFENNLLADKESN